MKHNHQPLPFGGLADPGDCPRCDQRRAELTAEGRTQHNHQRLPFGQRKPLGQCPRCDELHHGAAPRAGHLTRAQRDAADRQRSAETHRHFAPGGPHDRGQCGPVCTAGDW